MINSDLSRSELNEFGSIELYTNQYGPLREDRTIQGFVSSYLICVATDQVVVSATNIHYQSYISFPLGRLLKWRVHCAMQ